MYTSRDSIISAQLATFENVGPVFSGNEQNLLAGSEKVRLAPCVALIGCDGSGKTTLTKDIVRLIGTQKKVGTAYLGLGTGDLGRKIGQIPVVGPMLEHYLVGKAKKTHNKKEKIPGFATALVAFLLSSARFRRFRKMLSYRRQGMLVLTDRYPQSEMTGSFDGPALSPERAGSASVVWLANKEQELYRRMAGYPPSLIIRLNVDVDTAIARKPDHSRALLERKIEALPLLRFNGVPIIDVDATRPYADVLASLITLLREYKLIA